MPSWTARHLYHLKTSYEEILFNAHIQGETLVAGNNCCDLCLSTIRVHWTAWEVIHIKLRKDVLYNGQTTVTSVMRYEGVVYMACS